MVSTTTNIHPFIKEFEASLKRDQRFVKNWMLGWAYQDQRARLGKQYKSSLPQDFYSFQGSKDLKEWVNWMLGSPHPDYLLYLLDEKAEKLIEKAAKVDLRIFAQNDISVETDIYMSVLGRRNMLDYRLANMYPIPDPYKPDTVLDFGAGYGRQANLWTQLHPNLRFLSMDGIPKSYCLQRFYYEQLGVPLIEYMTSPETFKIEEISGIYHLPTWRFDLIPDQSVGLIMCIQVLPELSGRLVRYLIKEFHRILKPGGALLLRDGDTWLRSGLGFSQDSFFKRKGFSLEFKPQTLNPQDSHGVTRIWRKTDPRFINAKQLSPKQKIMRWVFFLDSKIGGVFRRNLKQFIK